MPIFSIGPNSRTTTQGLLMEAAPTILQSMNLILASTSPYRSELLARLGLPFSAQAPQFEEIRASGGLPPEELVIANALGKAESLSKTNPGSLIIGSDQVGFCEGEILEKPGTVQKAIDQLLRISGREHQLINGLAVVKSAGTQSSQDSLPRPQTRLVINKLRVRLLSRIEATNYVRRDNPIDCAGAYKVESLGISLFESISGDDPTAIIGLPLIALTGLLNDYNMGPLSAASHQGER